MIPSRPPALSRQSLKIRSHEKCREKMADKGEPPFGLRMIAGGTSPVKLIRPPRLAPSNFLVVGVHQDSFGQQHRQSTQEVGQLDGRADSRVRLIKIRHLTVLSCNLH